MLHSIFHESYPSIYLLGAIANSAPFEPKLSSAWRHFVSARPPALCARDHDRSLEAFKCQGRAL